VHSNLYDYAAQRPQIGGVDVKEERCREEFRHLEFETEHPVVRIHPKTGEPSLLLGHFCPVLRRAEHRGLGGAVRAAAAAHHAAGEHRPLEPPSTLR
jgi:hypothetical protein